jgi:hypothetical protein
MDPLQRGLGETMAGHRRTALGSAPAGAAALAGAGPLDDGRLGPDSAQGVLRQTPMRIQGSAVTVGSANMIRPWLMEPPHLQRRVRGPDRAVMRRDLGV